MQERLKTLLESAKREIASTSQPERVEELRVKYLGKKGELASVLGGMGKLAPEERRSLGEVANRVKGEVEGLLADAVRRAEDAQLESELKGPRVDISLPGRARAVGRRHPVSQTLEDLCTVFQRLGFSISSGPEVELDFYNFEALNLPADHPARDMQDTFYVDAKWLEGPGAKERPPASVLLRTHTSPVQVRLMFSKRPPIRSIMPGRVYRRDSDLTHTPQFHQLECLYVDKHVTFAELKGTLDAFVAGVFGAGTKTRFRPSFFPFVEPGAEVDISCFLCRGKGCRVCKSTGWIEVGGAGMVHPNVFRASGYDPAEVTGFAFGMGVERIAMLRHGIDDLRMMFENDLRFLQQF